MPGVQGTRVSRAYGAGPVLIDDCYADAGGRYMFHELQRTGRRFRGRFMIQSNFVRHPDRTCDVPDVTLTPEVPVMCEWVDLGLGR